ncbi:hypothetical protein EOA85_34440 [Mesorhizobium sp. M5C.F.Ca.IN.020.29.1.1]|nr:hypothetical protein EOA85_34440 [Mesorhizobium sp. M5C.F.Ca.IN.020.29.1.1]
MPSPGGFCCSVVRKHKAARLGVDLSAREDALGHFAGLGRESRIFAIARILQTLFVLGALVGIVAAKAAWINCVLPAALHHPFDQ